MGGGGPGGQQQGPGSEEEEAVGPCISYPLMTMWGMEGDASEPKVLEWEGRSLVL